MTMPKFTADATLYQASRHYRTGMHANSRAISESAGGVVYPVMEMQEEVINIHGCAPGWSDIGGTCWPNPLTEPPGTGSVGGDGFPGEPGDGGSGGGGGGLEDYWVCKSSCETTHRKCIDGCEGTLDNPKPSRNCLICDDNYQRCLRNCSRNIA